MCQPNACQNMWVTWVIAFQPDTIRQYMSRCTRINLLFIWICRVATYPRAYYKKEICVQQGLSTVQWYTTVPEIIWGLRSCIVSMKPLWICPVCHVTQSWPLKQGIVSMDDIVWPWTTESSEDGVRVNNSCSAVITLPTALSKLEHYARDFWS